MAVRQITAYQTSDGLLFESRPEVEQHEARRLKKEFKQWYEEHPLQEETSVLCNVIVSSLETIPVDTVFLWLMSNWTDLKEIIERR